LPRIPFSSLAKEKAPPYERLFISYYFLLYNLSVGYAATSPIMGGKETVYILSLLGEEKKR
jgi:hypothetical protein